MYVADVYGQGERTYGCSDDYQVVKNPNEWLECPVCKMKPLIWIYDNGCNCACGCSETYGKKLRCESILSRYQRNSEDKTIDSEELLKTHWNHYVETGEDLFTKKKIELAKKDIEIW